MRLRPLTRTTRSALTRRLTAAGTALAVAGGLVAALAAPATAAPRPTPDAFFGVHDTAAPDGSAVLPSNGSLRIWDNHTTWRDLQPTADGGWDWSRLDEIVSSAVRKRSAPVIVLGGTPAWAVAPGKPTPTEGDSAFLGPGAATPPDLAKWSSYVATVVKRYRTRGVRTYEVWNEPNVLRFWNGSEAEMAKLTRVTAQTIKAVDPKATVLSPGFVVRLPTQQRWFDRYAATGALRYVDAVSLHLYPMADQTPEDSMVLLAKARAILKRNKVSKPVWNTEVNYGLSGGSGIRQGVYSPALAAAYVSRTYLLNRNSSVGRVHWYGWRNMAFLGVNMLDTRGRPTAAAAAFATTRRWMSGQGFDGCSIDRRGTYLCRLVTARTVGYVYWNPTDARPTVAAPARTYQLEYLNGSHKSAKAGSKLRVGKAPILIRTRR